jgi:hypothetical protein
MGSGASHAAHQLEEMLRIVTLDQVLAAARRPLVCLEQAISRFYRRASPRPGLMLGFSGFPRQLIVPAATLLAEVVAKHAQLARSGP